MRRIIDGYFTLLKILAVLCLATMVVLVFGNVVLRYGFNQGITVSEELSRWAFVWLTFLGGIVVLRERGHMGIDLLLHRLPKVGERICLIIAQLLMLGCSLLFLQGSWAQMLINLSFPSPTSGLSMGWFYGSGVFFGVSAALIHFYEIGRLIVCKDIREPDSSPFEAHL
jgi:TRAP-type C4-dicarboxylate transport system permease small subunit